MCLVQERMNLVYLVVAVLAAHIIVLILYLRSGMERGFGFKPAGGVHEAKNSGGSRGPTAEGQASNDPRLTVPARTGSNGASNAWRSRRAPKED